MFGYFRPVNKITQKCHSAKQGKDTIVAVYYTPLSLLGMNEL